MNFNRIFVLGILTFPALLLVGTAGATPVTGIANIAGTVSVSGTSITFSPTFVSTSANETGSFAGLLGGSIQSLMNGPKTGNTFVSKFATFTEGTGAPVFFDLTYIAPGVGTLADCSSSALGAACTTTAAPLTVFQLPSNTVIATVQMSGNFYTGTSASGTSLATSIFNTQTALNGTIPQIVAMLSNGQAISGITYSASFEATPPVPEPVSVGLTGFGLLAAGLVARRKIGSGK